MIMWEDTDFTPEEFGSLTMNPILIQTLQALRNYTGRPIHIHSGYRREGGGFHPRGMAADIHIEGLGLVDQYLAAERFAEFGGIGVYPYWNNPGIHVDVRVGEVGLPAARWGSTSRGVYVRLGERFLLSLPN